MLPIWLNLQLEHSVLTKKTNARSVVAATKTNYLFLERIDGKLQKGASLNSREFKSVFADVLVLL